MYNRLILFVVMLLLIALAGFRLYHSDKLSNYKLLCINGVEYVNTESGVTTAYNDIGEIKNCKEPVTLAYYVNLNK